EDDAPAGQRDTGEAVFRGQTGLHRLLRQRFLFAEVLLQSRQAIFRGRQLLPVAGGFVAQLGDRIGEELHLFRVGLVVSQAFGEAVGGAGGGQGQRLLVLQQRLLGGHLLGRRVLVFRQGESILRFLSKLAFGGLDIQLQGRDLFPQIGGAGASQGEIVREL